MVQGPDPLVLLAALVIFPLVVAVTTLVLAWLPKASRDVVLSVLAVLFVVLVPFALAAHPR